MTSSPAARKLVALEDTRVAMRFTYIPGGSFVMGSPERETGRSNVEGPQHRAHVAPFFMGTTAVTQAQWTAVMGTAPFSTGWGIGPDRPAQNISWEMAAKFCRRLNEREWGASQGGPDTGTGPSPYRGAPEDRPLYRLPTETEWEYAARAGTTTAYSFGDGAKALSEFAWHIGNSAYTAQPVATRRSNPWGLYDVHGNVWQWCWDRYGPYSEAETIEGYAGPEHGDARVLRGGSFLSRGGSFLSPAEVLRSAARSANPPSVADVNFGFRCVRGVGAGPSMR